MSSPPTDICPICQRALRSDRFFVGMDYWCDHPRPHGAGPHYVCTFLDIRDNDATMQLATQFNIKNYQVRIVSGGMSVVSIGDDTNPSSKPIVMPSIDVDWKNLDAFADRLKKLLVFS